MKRRYTLCRDVDQHLIDALRNRKNHCEGATMITFTQGDCIVDMFLHGHHLCHLDKANHSGWINTIDSDGKDWSFSPFTRRRINTFFAGLGIKCEFVKDNNRYFLNWYECGLKFEQTMTHPIKFDS